MPYIAKKNTNFPVSIASNISATTNEKQEDDKWNGWVFNVGGYGNLSLTSNSEYYNLSGDLSIDKITEEWKLSFSLGSYYNTSNFDFGEFEGESCYVFSIKAKTDLSGGEKNSIVIDSMVTWFSTKTMEVMARNYDMSYDAGVYDFDVHMEVQMKKYGNYLVPKLLRYIGNWDVVFKKRERTLH